jgi:hypothetical protein
MIADKILWAAGKIVELRRTNVDAESLVERGKHVTKMNRPGTYLLAPS